MSPLIPKIALIVTLVVCFCGSPVSARRVNITYLGNCQDLDTSAATVFLRDVDYHLADDGTCDIVHGKLDVTTVDADPIELVMTLFKCPEANMATACSLNPTVHEELLNCDRLMNDDSGPWHMFTSAMDDGQCGDKIGLFTLSFARLRLEHLMKYLDVYDADYNTFRLKMFFKSTMTNTVRGCGELDFTLQAAV